MHYKVYLGFHCICMTSLEYLRPKKVKRQTVVIPLDFLWRAGRGAEKQDCKFSQQRREMFLLQGQTSLLTRKMVLMIHPHLLTIVSWRLQCLSLEFCAGQLVCWRELFNEKSCVYSPLIRPGRLGTFWMELTGLLYPQHDLFLSDAGPASEEPRALSSAGIKRGEDGEIYCTCAAHTTRTQSDQK